MTVRVVAVGLLFTELLLSFLVIVMPELQPLTLEEVNLWSNELSKNLGELSRKGLQYEELQRLYDEADYATEYINGTAKILELRSRLATFFTGKRRLAEQLAIEVGYLYDVWISDMAPYRSAAEHPDRDLNSLTTDVYLDADIPHRLPWDLNYDRFFQKGISESTSVMKIPESVNRSSTDIVDVVQWTAGLDTLFKRIRQEDPKIRWQYFASSLGPVRVYPGHEWPRNFVGFHEDYDARTRPWYTTAISGPKDIVIVFDASSSMMSQGSFHRAKKVVYHILESLNQHDYVNVVVSRSPYWTAAGRLVNRTVSVLGCQKTRLVAATTGNRRQLMEAMQEITADGGSDHLKAFEAGFDILRSKLMIDGDQHCQRFLVLVTDGQGSDEDQRCDPGHEHPQTREHVPGEKCSTNFENIIHMVHVMQYQLPTKAHMFTFLTTDQPSDQVLPGELACDNEGAMAVVSSDENVIEQMTPYFSFLAVGSGQRQALWTSPYVDGAGTGLLVTVAVPVYSNVTDRSLGVVGIDVPLQHIETLLTHELWGSVYSFMVNRVDGSTVFHPFFTPSTELTGDPVLVAISSLETNLGEPLQFQQVTMALAAAHTGDTAVTEGARRAVPINDRLLWRPVPLSHYFFTDIPDSDFSVAFVLSQHDEVYQHARDPADHIYQSFLDQMDTYKTTELFAGVYDELQPTQGHLLYPGLTISLLHSVVKLAPRAFCDPEDYLIKRVPSFQDIHQYINTFVPTYELQCPAGTFRSDVRPDVKITSLIEEKWLARNPELHDLIAWSYIGTMSGMMRIYPGVELARDYDPTSRPWYRQAEANRGRLAVSVVDKDPHMGKMISLSRAVHKAKPLTPPDCTVPRRDYGCPCNIDIQCKSGYCYLNSCADDIIQGVTGMDIRYRDFVDIFNRIIQGIPTTKYCRHTYTCGDDQDCETRCYLVDRMGYLVIDQSFTGVSDTLHPSSGKRHLASVHGSIMKSLLDKAVYAKMSSIDHQGRCLHTPVSPEDPPVPRKTTSIYADEIDVTHGPIPPFQNEYSCSKQVKYYLANTTRLQQIGGTLHGNLEHDPCGDGLWYFLEVPDTNLYLLVLDEYRGRKQQFNFNCIILNSVFTPGTYKLPQAGCDSYNGQHVSHDRNRSCSKPTGVVIPCGYSNTANTATTGTNMITLLVVCIYCTQLTSAEHRFSFIFSLYLLVYVSVSHVATHKHFRICNSTIICNHAIGCR